MSNLEAVLFSIGGLWIIFLTISHADLWSEFKEERDAARRGRGL